MTSHVIAYQSLELLYRTHTFHFNCFFEDFDCVFMKYAAYLGCCKLFGNYSLWYVLSKIILALLWFKVAQNYKILVR